MSAMILFDRQTAYERGEVGVHDAPQDVHIDGIVAVYEPVSQANDFRPRNGWMSGACLGGDSRRGLAHDFKQPDEGEAQNAVRAEI